MTLLEYIQSLQDQNLYPEEIFAKAQEWKKNNPQQEVEEEVEEIVDPTPTKQQDLNPVIAQFKNREFDIASNISKPGEKNNLESISLGDLQTKLAVNPENIKKQKEEYNKYLKLKNQYDKDFKNITSNLQLKNEDQIGSKFNPDTAKSDVIITAPGGRTTEKKMTKQEFDSISKSSARGGISIKWKDKEWSKKGVESYLELPLDEKIKIDIKENNLNKDFKYIDFIKKPYTGYGFDEFREDSSPVANEMSSTYNFDELNNSLDNFNSDDFLGFLRETGLGDQYLSDILNEEVDKYGVSGEKKSIMGTSLNQELELARQRDLNRNLNIYLNQKEQDYNNQLQLNWIKNNPNAVKGVKSLDAAKEIAKKYFLKEYKTSFIPLFDRNQIQNYKEKAFPSLVENEKLQKTLAQEEKQKRINNSNLEGTLQTITGSFESIKDTLTNKVREQAFALGDFIGLDGMASAKLIGNEKDILDQADDISFFYATGDKAKVGDYTYIRDEEGIIYNTDLGIIETNLSEVESKSINKALDESSEKDSDYNLRGGVEQFSGVVAGLSYDIAGMFGVGKFTKVTKLGKVLPAIKMSSQTFSTMGYYGFSGYASTKKDMYQKLVDSGVTDDEADDLSTDAAKLSGMWYAATSLIAPNSAYLNRAEKILNFNNIYNTAVNAYKKGGQTSFRTVLGDKFKKITPTRAGVFGKVKAGGQEVVQENIQELGITKGVNVFANNVLGEDVLDTDYTFQDFWRTSLLSFGAGSLIADVQTGYKGKPKQQLQNLFYIAQDAENVQKRLNLDVANGNISQKEADKLMFDARAVYNQSAKIPPNTNELIQIPSAILMQEIADLENKMKTLNEAFHTPVQKQIADKKAELKNLTEQSDEINELEKERAETVGMSILPTRKSIPKADELATQYQQDPSAVDVEALLDQYNKIGLAAIKFDTRKGDMAREDAIAEINKEFAGIMDRWSPDKGSFSTFVTANIAPKAQGIYDKYIGQKDATTLDRPEAREVVAEEVEVDVTPQETGRAKVYPATLEVITENVTPEVRSEQTVMVKDDINRAVATVSTSPKVVAKNLVDQIKTKEYKQLLKNKLGKWNSDQYNDNVDRLITKDFIATIPVAQLKRRFPRLFEIEVIDRVPTVKIEDGKRTDFKKPVYKIPAITDAKLETIKEYFKDNEKRHQSLMEVLGEGIAIEQMQELRGDQAFMNDLQGRLELKGSDLTAEQFLDEVEFNLDKRNLEDKSLDVLEAEIVEEIKIKPKEKLVVKKITPVEFDKTWGDTKAGVTNQINKADSKYFSDTKQEKAKKQLLLFENLARLGFDPDIITRAGNLTVGYRLSEILNRLDGDINYITDINKLEQAKQKDADKRKQRKKSNRDLEYDATKKAYEKGEIISISEIIGGLRKIFKNEGFTIDKDIKAATSGQAGNNAAAIDRLINRNIKDYSKIKKGLKKVFDIFRKVKSDLRAPLLDILFGKSNLSQNVGRQLGPLLGKMKNFIPGLKIIKEHALQHGVTTRLIGDMMNSSKKIADAIQARLEKNMMQFALTTTAQEVFYRSGSKNIFDGSKIEKSWKAKSEMNPFLLEQHRKLLAGEITTEEYLKTSDLLRYFNEYFYLNGNAVEMYNNKTGQLESLFKVIGANVASDIIVSGKTYKANELMGVSKENGVAFYPNIVKEQAFTAMKITKGEWTVKQGQAYLKTAVKPALMADLANLNMQSYIPQLLQKLCGSPCRVPRTSNQVKETLVNSGKAKVNAQKVNKETKGLSAFDMDDTLALTKEKVLYTMPDGKTGELTAGEFAVEAENLTEQGAEFDFTNFENVDLSTPKGPLAGEALKKQAKYGSKDIYVVTARPGAAQESIKLFLDSIGLNIPLENIITLEDGSPQAKADWVISKAEQGYNDFYFADDSALNVDTVQKILDQIDVKSKTQIAIADKAKRLDTEFNKQIEDVTGKEDFKKYSDARARLEGKQKDKGVFKRFINQFTITPSADDFMGLMYAFMGKGKQGNKHAKFIKENLMDPYNKAEQELLSSKVTVANDFAALREAFPTLKSKRGKNPLMEEIGVGPYTRSQAIRVYMWNKQGMEIPGMSKRDIDALVAAVESDLELKPFADNVMLVQKNKQYPAPGTNWLAGDITTDILKGLDTTYRKELMTEFNENVNIIFSKENLNKIEAVYGSKFRESLVDSLRRMKTGSNRPVFVGSGSRIVNEMMDWLNSSVGAVMFLNMRSGLLQLISNVNFINWGDNNIYNAAKAFTSKDYFPTVLKLLNSDYLVNRRDGLKINVNEAELADAGRQGGIKGMINYILDKGFAITRVMDSVAIATGGATFFINRKQSLQNRVNPETGKLYTEQEADAKTFDDFYAIAEETQQSSNPSRISQQQASLAGRVILSFQNVTMQYNRKTKKSIQDLYNRRTKPGMNQRESDLSNLSSVMYYVAVQNLVFNALQQALFALAFDDEPEEKDKDKAANIANGMLDSLLFGLGFGGAIVSTVKNVAMKIANESEKKSTQYRDVVWSVFDISPVLDSKVRKLRTAAKTFDWNMDEIKKRGWSLDNPAYLAISQIVSASTNLPLDRVLRKVMNIGQAFDEETKTWQRVALLLGWSGWNLDLPYWGRESTIKKEEATEARIKEKYSIDVRRMKSIGFTKRVPLTGPNSGKPSGKLGVDYIQLERPDGKIQYYKKP